IATVATSPATTPTSAPDGKGTYVVTVAQDGSADCTKLSTALARARPGAVIRIVDNGEYKESILINDAERWRGITIEALAGSSPTIVSPDEQYGVLIRDTPGVVLRGVHVSQGHERQHAVVIRGAVAGVTLDRVALKGHSQKYSLVYVVGAAGEENQPI